MVRGVCRGLHPFREVPSLRGFPQLNPARDGCAQPAAGQLPVEVKTLVVLNDLAYGTERSYNGLRLAHALAKRDGEEVRVFLLGHSVTCALAGQKTPNGYYNRERMIAAAIERGAKVGLCGTCMDARAIGEEQVDGAARTSRS
jgi:uncharacterized protein involved in oxidation of intracellular sulfur